MKSLHGLCLFVCLFVSAVIATPALAGNFTAGDEAFWTAVMRSRTAYPSDATARPNPTVTADGNLAFPVGAYVNDTTTPFGLRGIVTTAAAATSGLYDGILLGNLTGRTISVTYRLYTPDLAIGEPLLITDFAACSYRENDPIDSLLNNPVPDIRMAVTIHNLSQNADRRGEFLSEPISDKWFLSDGTSLITNGEWRTMVVPLEAANFMSWMGNGSPTNPDKPEVAAAFAHTLANVEWIRLDIGSGVRGYGGFAWADTAEGGRIVEGWLEVGEFTSYVVPEPATMSLLALGGLALLRRRK